MTSERIYLGAAPVGFGQETVAPPDPDPRKSSIWPEMILSSVVCAVTGLVVEEVADRFRRRKRR